MDNQTRFGEAWIKRLSELGAGDLSLFRAHANRRLDHSLDIFDLFTGLWWPLRQSNKAPKREVAWLIAKLFGFGGNIKHEPGKTLATRLRQCEPIDPYGRNRFRAEFDSLLTSPFSRIEPPLRWALGEIKSQLATSDPTFDWAELIKDLSNWDNETTRYKWAKEYLSLRELTHNANQGG